MAKKKEATTTSNSPSGTKKVVATKTAPLKKKTITRKKLVPIVAKNNTLKLIDNSTQLLANSIIEGILEVKGRNISVLNLTEIRNRVCDCFIICQADSNTQVNAIANSVEEMVQKLTGERPYRKEGFENAEWILVDYVTVVVHIFQTQVRNFYNLESLWADAQITEIAVDK